MESMDIEDLYPTDFIPADVMRDISRMSGYSNEQIRCMTYCYQYYTGGRSVDPWMLAQAMEAEGLGRGIFQNAPINYGSFVHRWSDPRIARTPPPEEFQVVRRLSERAANPGLLVNDKDSFLDSNPMSQAFSDMEDAVLGVDAAAYLARLIEEPHAYEPLLPALGGEPIGLKQNIEKELDRWAENHIRPLFVFDGQSIVGKEDTALRQAKTALTKTAKAWDLYNKNSPGEAVIAFGTSGAVRIEDLFRTLQGVLAERELPFTIAPFTAGAQLAHLLKICPDDDKAFIDGIMGSKELLLYIGETDAIFFPPTAEDWDKKRFSGIFKDEKMKELGVTTADMFEDALLMVGTSFLPPFPPLQDTTITTKQPFSVMDALNLLRTSEKSVTSACNQFSDILQNKDPNWMDKYRKAKMAVKHVLIVTEDGKIHIKDWDHLTGDNFDYLGLQLPGELFHYLYEALIGPRIMNCITHLQYLVYPTLDGSASDEYKRLVTSSLVPVKEMTVALISSRIHRAIQYKDINLRFWFDDNLKHTLVHRNLQPQTNNQADGWRVRNAELKPQETATGTSAGTFSFALLSLQSKEFATKTITKEKAAEKIPILESKSEVMANILWRLLHLRGYINDQHELTAWGRALAATLKSIHSTVEKYNDIHHTEEAAFLAFELIRFDLLNSRPRNPELVNGPLRGSDADKANCLLIGRSACLLKVRHKDIGYTGPLSKNFLAQQSIIKTVRETDRDLLEAIAASLFMNAQATRDRKDLGDIGRSLPLLTDIDAGLGIAVKTYLDDFVDLQWTKEERATKKANYGEKFLPHGINIKEDLDVTFEFFDAVHEGVKTLGDEMTAADKKVWDDASAYLELRR